MAETFFFYDLETSGFSPRNARIMQFAGQRTDLNLKPIGKPVNVLIKLTADVLPDPQAILITGITPQRTLEDGITEAEFLKMFEKQVSIPGTIFVGYNTVRFDDEFMRFLHYRNFYDPYEWQWKDDRSRWDLLDVVRMTRALRPDGIKWPIDNEGRPTNRLELLSSENSLDHANAHDALSDVNATIAVARLLQTKQPKLFGWLLNLRGKNEVKKFLKDNKTFIYSSGKYPGETEKTAVVRTIYSGDDRDGVLVYDLRFEPDEFLKLTPDELAERWQYNRDPDASARLPIKTLKYNHCPAISPTGVLSDKGVQQRLQITPELAQENASKLTPEFVSNVLKARKLLNVAQEKRHVSRPSDPDTQLYDGFFADADRQAEVVIRQTEPDQLGQLADKLQDKRLKKLLPLYKARNFPDHLSDEERTAWQEHCAAKLLSGEENSRLSQFEGDLQDIAGESELNKDQQNIIEDLQAYAQEITSVISGVSK